MAIGVFVFVMSFVSLTMVFADGGITPIPYIPSNYEYVSHTSAYTYTENGIIYARTATTGYHRVYYGSLNNYEDYLYSNNHTCMCITYHPYENAEYDVNEFYYDDPQIDYNTLHSEVSGIVYTSIIERNITAYYSKIVNISSHGKVGTNVDDKPCGAI